MNIVISQVPPSRSCQKALLVHCLALRFRHSRDDSWQRDEPAYRYTKIDNRHLLERPALLLTKNLNVWMSTNLPREFNIRSPSPIRRSLLSWQAPSCRGFCSFLVVISPRQADNWFTSCATSSPKAWLFLPFVDTIRRMPVPKQDCLWNAQICQNL